MKNKQMEPFQKVASEQFRMFDRLIIPIKVINKSPNPLPTYGTKQSSCFDLQASNDAHIPGYRQAIISTGLYFKIPDGYEVQIRSRSGMAAKHQICVLNSPGTIDSDYIGEIKVILINHSSFTYVIKQGDRIAQAIIVPVYKASWEEVETLEETERGTGGFGSTGK